MRTMSKFLVGAAALVLLAGCAKHIVEGPVSIEIQDADASVPADLLRSAPVQVEVAGVPVKLTTTASRKFVGEEGDATAAEFIVAGVDGKALPAGLTIAEAWLLSPTSLWETDVTAIPAVEGQTDKVAAAASGGPRWVPGSPVEAVVRLKDADGKAYLLRQGEVTISKVE